MAQACAVSLPKLRHLAGYPSTTLRVVPLPICDGEDLNRRVSPSTYPAWLLPRSTLSPRRSPAFPGSGRAPPGARCFT